MCSRRVDYIHSSGYEQIKQPFEEQARFLGHSQADKKGTGGDDHGRNQLWPEGVEEKEKGRVSQSMVQMAVSYQAFWMPPMGAHAKQWLGFQETAPANSLNKRVALSWQSQCAVYHTSLSLRE